MKATRREFIKQSSAAFSIAMLMPGLSISRPQQSGRKILALVQLGGGNDGLNTVIPYKDPRYHSLRPSIGFKEEELKDAEGNSTIINSEFAFHPALSELKGLFQQGRLAVVQGVGYPNPDLSHGISNLIWETADVSKQPRLGWLGKYADSALAGKSSLAAVSIGFNSLPRVLAASKVNPVAIRRLGESPFRVINAAETDNVLRAFRDNISREFPAGSFLEKLARVGANAERSGGQLQEAIEAYHSSVIYAEANPVAQALKTVAVLATVFPDATIFHVAFPSFYDTHARQIGTAEAPRNKHLGTHATDLKRLSEAIKAFYDDMVEQNLADDVLLMTYSEFGRRPNENASLGTDHGTASNLFVVGNKVKGGDFYGLQPSLNATDFDTAGNMRFTTDFRSVYATVLDRWLEGGDSEAVLGARFPLLGFL